MHHPCTVQIEEDIKIIFFKIQNKMNIEAEQVEHFGSERDHKRRVEIIVLVTTYLKERAKKFNLRVSFGK